MKKLSHYMFYSMALLLTAVADMATSTSTAYLWYEPDCPKELWK